MPDELLSHNAEYAASYHFAGLPREPSHHLAIVTCIDARFRVYGMLGLSEGDAHVIRNAGGIVTDDTIRSLLISQRLLGTRHVFVIHHTDCGMATFDEGTLKEQIESETGLQPPFPLGSFASVEDDVRGSVAVIKQSPFIPYRDSVRGFVFDVATGKLSEVD